MSTENELPYEEDPILQEVERKMKEAKEHGVFSHRWSCSSCGKLEWCVVSAVNMTAICQSCFAKKEYKRLESEDDWIRKYRSAKLKFAIKNRKREAV